MKTKSITMDYNPCHNCMYSYCAIDTCIYLRNCHTWEEFYHKDGSLKENDNYIFVDNGIHIIGKIKVTDIEKIIKERNN